MCTAQSSRINHTDCSACCCMRAWLQQEPWQLSSLSNSQWDVWGRKKPNEQKTQRRKNKLNIYRSGTHNWLGEFRALISRPGANCGRGWKLQCALQTSSSDCPLQYTAVLCLGQQERFKTLPLDVPFKPRCESLLGHVCISLL